MTFATMIRVPSGRWVTAGQYAKAWNIALMAGPGATLRGWQWHAVEARDVLNDMRRALMDFINRHDRTRHVPHLTDARLRDKIMRAVARGAIRYECAWCGTGIAPRHFMHYRKDARFCGDACRRDYYGA